MYYHINIDIFEVIYYWLNGEQLISELYLFLSAAESKYFKNIQFIVQLSQNVLYNLQLSITLS